MTLACADVNSNILDVGTVADVHDEKLVENSLVEIWCLSLVRTLRLYFGHVLDAKFLFRL